jgi:hypothetical protein
MKGPYVNVQRGPALTEPVDPGMKTSSKKAHHAIIARFQLLLYKIPLKTRGYHPGEGEEI